MNSKLSRALIWHIKTGYSISMCIEDHVFSINFHAIHLKSCHVYTYDFFGNVLIFYFYKNLSSIVIPWLKKKITHFFTNKNNHWFVGLKWNYKSYESKYGLKTQRLDFRKSSGKMSIIRFDINNCWARMLNFSFLPLKGVWKEK